MRKEVRRWEERREERCSGSDNERDERQGRSGEEEGEKLKRYQNLATTKVN